MLKQLKSLSRKKGADGSSSKLTDRQKEELLELRRVAEQEMKAQGSADDIYLREYIQNLDELLRVGSVS